MRVQLHLQMPDDSERKKKKEGVIPAKPIKKRKSEAPKQSDRFGAAKVREEP